MSCSGEPATKSKDGGQECPPYAGILVIYFADPTSLILLRLILLRLIHGNTLRAGLFLGLGFLSA